MVKKAGKTKGNGAAKAKAKTAKPKARKTAEELSDQQRQALLFAHKRKLVPLLAAEKDAKAAVTKAFDLAKNEGIPKKDLKLAIQLETEEGIEAAKAEVERAKRISRWMGLGKQLELFGVEKETVAQRHYEDGRRAALEDKPAKPPSHLSQKDANIWLDGHSAGRTALNTERASGFKPLGEVVSDLVPPAPAMPAEAGAAAAA